MALKKHGITENTPSELMFQSATIYKNLKFQTNDWAGDVLGATSGGSKFALVEEFADAEVDGALVKFKGGKVKIGETGTLEVNMTEFKEDVLKTALHLVEDTAKTVAGYKAYRKNFRTCYESALYVWVSDKVNFSLTISSIFVLKTVILFRKRKKRL